MALITAKPVKPPPGYAATAAQRRANQAKPYNALAPLTPAQMTTAAHQQLDPVVAALTSSIQGQADRASGAIGANSAAAAKALAGINFTAPYQQAEQGQASVDAALRDSLAGGGQGLASDLSSRLAQIGDPSVATAAGQVAGIGQAAGGTQVAEGSASLSNLLAQAAAAGGYGAKQPGIARLAGLQDIAKTEQQAQTDIASGKTTLLGQLPGIMQHLQDTELQKALARQSGLLDTAKVKASTYSVTQRTNAQKATLGERTAHDKALETIAQQNANTAQQRANQAAAKSTKPKPLTPAQRKTALDRIDLYYYGTQPDQRYDSTTQRFIPVPGTGVPAVDYPTAVKNLTALGLSQAQAINLANSRYKPGEDGRPESPGQKKVAAAESQGVQAASNALSSIFGGH